MCFSDAGHQTAATVPSFLYSLAAETDLVFPFQVLEVLLRVEEARLGLAQGCLVLLIVAHNRPQALHLLQSLQCSAHTDVTPGSLMHQLNVQLYLDVGLLVLQSQINPGDLLPLQCDRG